MCNARERRLSTARSLPVRTQQAPSRRVAGCSLGAMTHRPRTRPHLAPNYAPVAAAIHALGAAKPASAEGRLVAWEWAGGAMVVWGEGVRTLAGHTEVPASVPSRRATGAALPRGRTRQAGAPTAALTYLVAAGGVSGRHALAEQADRRARVAAHAAAQGPALRDAHVGAPWSLHADFVGGAHQAAAASDRPWRGAGRGRVRLRASACLCWRDQY